MSAMETLSHLLGIKIRKFSSHELLIMEAELFSLLYQELKRIFKNKYNDYFRLIKVSIETEENMFEDSFVRYVIEDILSTEEYTLQGIAYYTRIPEEVIYEVAIGYNTSPSVKFLRKILELHRSIRKDLYDGIMKKMNSSCA